jgi:two-component system, OmpR family, alkaline phosphatase synthesis response regulator PhoP
MSNEEYRILLVDDEPDIIEFISYNLKKEGFAVSTATNGIDAVQKATDIKPHLIILDVMMPGMDGIETCEQIKAKPELRDTLIAFLTARGEDYSQIAGFEAGADDYITKPVKPKVLVSRIRALLKRYGNSDIGLSHGNEITTSITLGDLTIDRERYVVVHKTKELDLPKKEFELLLLLASKPDGFLPATKYTRPFGAITLLWAIEPLTFTYANCAKKLGKTTSKPSKGWVISLSTNAFFVCNVLMLTYQWTLTSSKHRIAST